MTGDSDFLAKDDAVFPDVLPGDLPSDLPSDLSPCDKLQCYYNCRLSLKAGGDCSPRGDCSCYLRYDQYHMQHT